MILECWKIRFSSNDFNQIAVSDLVFRDENLISNFYFEVLLYLLLMQKVLSYILSHILKKLQNLKRKI